MSRQSIFISYATAQRAWVDVLHRNLKRCLGKDEVFIDHRDIPPGKSFVGVLEAALANAERVVLVVTPEAMASPWVRQEVKSHQATKPWSALGGRLQIVMAVRVAVPLFLEEIQAIDFTRNDEVTYCAQFAVLFHALTDGVLGDDPLSDGIEIPEPPHAVLPADLRERIVSFLAIPLAAPGSRRFARPAMCSELKIEDGLLTKECQFKPEGAASALLVHGAREMGKRPGIRNLPEHQRPLAAKAAVLRKLKNCFEDSDQDVLDGFIKEIDTLAADAKPAAAPVAADPLDAYRRLVQADSAHVAPVFHGRAAFAELGRITIPLALRGERVAAQHGTDEARQLLGSRDMSLDDLLDLEPATLPGGHHRWVALGDPGSGKTTLLRHFAVELAQAGHARRTPLYLRLPKLLSSRGPFAGAIEQLVAQGVAADGLNDAFTNRARAGEIVFLLDGLDEVGDHQRDAVKRHVRALASQFAKAPFVVASRRVPYEPIGAGFMEVEVQPFDRDKRLRFLSSWFEHSPKNADTDAKPADRAAALISLLEADRPLWELSGNPLYLTLIALLVDSDVTLRQGRAALYHDVIKLLLHGGHRPAEESIASPLVVRRTLVFLATRLTEANSKGEPKDQLENVLRREPSVRRDLETVKRWDDKAGVFLDDVANLTGILGPSAEGEDWRFGHRTFRESLVAECLAELWARGGQDEVIDRAKTVGGDLSAWAEAFALLAGHEAVKDPDRLILALAAARPEVALGALASAPQVAPETIQKVVGLTDDWQERARAFMRIPDQVADPMAALRLLDTLRRGTTDGNDLYFLYSAIERLRAEHADLAIEANRLLSIFFDHTPLADPDRRRFETVETRLHGKVDLFVAIPAGEFTMGDRQSEYEDEQAAHRVVMTSGFQITCVAVTNAQYRAFDREHEMRPWQDVAAEDLGQHPAVNLSWYAARSFCRWLSAVLPDQPAMRLPSEEEWEYACRATSEGQYCSGDGEANLKSVGWYRANSEGRTHRVAQKEPNRWGLYDMHGNVWEWNAALWDAELYAAREDGFEHNASTYQTPADLAGDADPARGASRVVRGGGYWDSADWARSAYRGWFGPGDGVPVLGFRVVRSSPCSDA